MRLISRSDGGRILRRPDHTQAGDFPSILARGSGGSRRRRDRACTRQTHCRIAWRRRPRRRLRRRRLPLHPCVRIDRILHADSKHDEMAAVARPKSEYCRSSWRLSVPAGVICNSTGHSGGGADRSPVNCLGYRSTPRMRLSASTSQEASAKRAWTNLSTASAGKTSASKCRALVLSGFALRVDPSRWPPAVLLQEEARDADEDQRKPSCPSGAFAGRRRRRPALILSPRGAGAQGRRSPQR
jgi:hypothetical protein